MDAPGECPAGGVRWDPAVSSDRFMKLLDPKHLIETFGTIGLILIVYAESGILIGLILPGDSLPGRSTSNGRRSSSTVTAARRSCRHRSSRSCAP
jgi:hypothetical protein